MDKGKLYRGFADNNGRNAPVFVGLDKTLAVELGGAIEVGRSGRGSVWAGGWHGESLKLDFTNQQYAMGSPGNIPDAKTFAELVTFTRSTGGGRFNAAGQYEWLPADEPRFDYDPVTLQPLGLLIEEQRTNLLTYSDDFNNAVWSKVNATIALAGAWSKLVEDSSTGVHSVFRTHGSAVTGQSYSFSVRAKAAERTSCYLRFFMDSNYYGAKFDLIVGAISEVSPGITATSVPTLDGGFRCTITRAAATTATVQAFIYASQVGGYAGDGVSGVLISAAQLELGQFPTSYIPTTTAQVTRAADAAQVSEVSPWFNPDAGSLFSRLGGRKATIGGAFAVSLGSSAGSYMGSGYSTQTGPVGTFFARNAGVGPSMGDLMSRERQVFAYGDRRFFGCNEGGEVLVASLPSPPPVEGLRMGNSYFAPTVTANAHIREIRYYPRRLKNSELQAITA